MDEHFLFLMPLYNYHFKNSCLYIKGQLSYNDVLLGEILNQQFVWVLQWQYKALRLAGKI